MIAATLSGAVLAGVLSAFLLIGRTSANASNYSELESQARKALEIVGREARMANSILGSNFSSTSITLGIPDSSSSSSSVAYQVTYTFDSTNKIFTRTGPPLTDPTGASTTTVLVSGVQTIPNVTPFRYYRYITGNYDYNNTSSNLISMPGGNPVEVKQIEINFIAQRTNTTVATATNKVISARFILRNK